MKIKMEIISKNKVSFFERDFSESDIDRLVDTICSAWYDPDRFEGCPKTEGSFLYFNSIMDLPALAMKYEGHNPQDLYDKYLGRWLLFVDIPYELMK